MKDVPVQQKFASLGLAFDANKATRVRMPREESAKESTVVEADKPNQQEKTVRRGRSARSATFMAPLIDWESKPKQEQPVPAVSPLEERKAILKNSLGVKEAQETELRKGSAEQRAVIRKLIAKHGADYGAMSRDIKINVWQKTKSKLRKEIYLYLLTAARPEDFERLGVKMVDGLIVPADPED